MTEGELLIGLGTLALALATVWLAFEARKTRTDADKSRRRRLLRSTLAELLDDLRIWTTANPAHGEPALERLRRSEPKLGALDRLIEEVNMPADVAVYLVWLAGRIREEWVWWPHVFAVGSGDPNPASHPPNSGVGRWALMVDQLLRPSEGGRAPSRQEEMTRAFGALRRWSTEEGTRLRVMIDVMCLTT